MFRRLLSNGSLFISIILKLINIEILGDNHVKLHVGKKRSRKQSLEGW